MEQNVRIVEYAPHHRSQFKSLNLDWIRRYFTVEDADLKMLDDPEGSILRPGGFIFMAEMGDEVVGTCALIREEDGSFELAKMAVKESVRGSGIGYRLGAAAIERARQEGAPRVELLSNRALQPALRLYARLGFTEAPLEGSVYRRADIRMVLDLEGGEGRENPGMSRRAGG